MGVVKNRSKSKDDDVKNKDANGKPVKDGKVKKKKKVSCLQCIKSADDGGLEGKYRVAAPELMQDTFMSDSEDEGGEVECPIQQQQQYRYMNSEAGTLHRAKPLEDSVTDGHLWPSNNDSKVATIDRQPLDIGFLVSFVVDARGGAMKAKRRGGVRIVVPSGACAAPTRVTCRAATRRAPAAAPPPLMEGEALASRLLELQPQGAKFLAPVIIEVPIFTASSPDREIVILRSDTGETWQDHYLHNNDNPMIQEALQRERQDHGTSGETLGENGERVTRIITCDFPHYLAVVSRIRQEVHIIGPEGGTISSVHIPQVQALFPPHALTKRIRVGLQAHAASPALCARALPRLAAVSPVITVEPRRRKFHTSITLAAPLPRQGDKHDKQSTTNLRLLCSIMGGQARAVWEDVTGSTPLTITDDCASFTTTVSARFWLMNCQNVSDATKLATELYREMLLVPFDVRIVVLGKRLDALEGRLLVLYITDRYAYDTLLHQEHYTEVAHSTAVRLLDGKEVHLEFSGNLVPVTKSGTQPVFKFQAFKDNRVEFPVRVKHHEEKPSGRIYFMNEPKVPKGEQSQTPACVLDVELPERIAPRAGKSQLDYLNLDQSGFDALKDELSFHWGEHNNTHGPGSIPLHIDQDVNGHDVIVTNGDVKYTTKATEDRDIIRPQANGDTPHVDSNKVKATFDSDEDKTPMNTLEKGKKKEGGFFGGLADKVKNVFSHSEVRDDEKESSPKPQPKPREPKETKSKEKEKSPPKPAPRIINEDLLDKVDDMFKDLKTKPRHQEEDDLNNKVYSTKLVVDEGEKPLHNIKEEIYEQYENRQPIDTPLHCKTSDPFIFYTGCCEGKYKKGQKHRHDETSTLVDRIEQVKFAANEKLQKASDDVNINLKGGLEELEREKDDIKQKASEDLLKITEKVKCDVMDKEEEVKNKLHDVEHKVDRNLHELADSVHKTHDDATEKVLDAQSKIAGQIDHAKSAAKDGVAGLTSKIHEVNFAAQERAEQLRLTGQERLSEVSTGVEDKADNIKQKAGDVATDLKNKANDGVIAVGDAIHNVQDKLSSKAKDVKEGVKKTAEHVKDATNEKLNDLNQSVEDAKDKAEKAAADLKSKTKEAKDDVKIDVKKKAKEGKKFFSGLFGKKEKIENDIKDKIAETKESAKELADRASAEKDRINDEVTKKGEELKERASAEKDRIKDEVSKKGEELKEHASAEKDRIKDEISRKGEELKERASAEKDRISDELYKTGGDLEQRASAAKDKIQNEISKKQDELKDGTESLVQNMEQKGKEVKQAIHEKKDEVDAVQNKVSDVTTALQNKTEEAIVIRKNEFENKKDEISRSICDKTDEIEKFVHDTVDDAKIAIHNKSDEIEKSIDDKKEEIGHKKDELVKLVTDKRADITTSIHDTVEGTKSKIQNKKDEVEKSIENQKEELSAKKDEIVESVSDKKDEISKAVHYKVGEVQNSAQTELDRIRHEAELATDDIKRTAEDTINAAANKKSEIQSSIGSKVSEIYESGKDNLHSIQETASDKINDLQRSSKQAFENAEDTALSSFDRLESTAKDTAKDAKDTWDDVQSSTRNTFAEYKDDVHDFENSAQDTLHSFQSSAGNTFDSLDDSAREFIGGVQNAEANSKDVFQGFQISADNKLEDIRGAVDEGLHEADERLGEAKETFEDSVKATEKALVDTVSSETDKFTSNLNDLGNSVFGSSGKGFMKDSSTKLLESEKAQSSPNKKGSGIPKLRKKK